MLPVLFGLAPAREEIFETIWELSAAMGIFGAGFTASGGAFEGVGDFVGGVGGLIGAEEGFGIGLEGGAFDCMRGEALGAADVWEGFEGFVGSAGADTGFAEISRTLLNILDVSGVTGVFDDVCGAAFGGIELGGVGAFVAAFCTWIELVAGLETGVSIAGSFDVVVRVFAVTGFDTVAFVDFALVVDFFVDSGISTSTGSEMTFLGRPLFLATSEDMLRVELSCGENFGRTNSPKG